ncbi:UPF0496 protein At1g20180-like [Prosopis cineraria]|uniref:UPF0496 protein At1g20180-like n=1 Tax=Prosopis cineraria TaxID=364024 RepID=UPI0024103BFF|nr:UPF0496 protein At1g20180-like [Prosopis cineraria]
MTNTRWFKLIISPMPRVGRSRKESDEDSLCRKPNVNEEYQEAFRTKSYMEICSKAQGQLVNASITTTPSSSPSSSLPYSLHLTEHLLEPQQETVTNMTQTLKRHHLLLEYFEASLEACHYCDTILEAILHMHVSYKKITRVLKLSKFMLDCPDTDRTHKAIYRDLASFARQKNPFSIISSSQFRDIHKAYAGLLHRLKSEDRKIRRRGRFKRICKMVGGVGLTILHGAILISLLIFALHSIVGTVAAPCIVVGLVGLFRKRIKRALGSDFGRQCEQLDIAAKGVYMLINDFDTMSRMVKRLQEEVDHRQAVADMCVKNGKCEILKQVLREFHDHESNFLDQLEELEEHIYLCFLTINRSRKLVLQEIMEKQ